MCEMKVDRKYFEGYLKMFEKFRTEDAERFAEFTEAGNREMAYYHSGEMVVEDIVIEMLKKALEN